MAARWYRAGFNADGSEMEAAIGPEAVGAANKPHPRLRPVQ
ncbi:MAG TPA: hypothetical protein VHK63_03960 [Candidatus Limnocylindria bacterium]|nr:hypothetical protein [Candidatus Limnocylindria bacterium]